MTATERFFTLLVGLGLPVIGLLITSAKGAFNTGKLVQSSEQLAKSFDGLVVDFSKHVDDSALIHRRHGEDIARLQVITGRRR